jgi:hypothetical protein
VEATSQTKRRIGIVLLNGVSLLANTLKHPSYITSVVTIHATYSGSPPYRTMALVIVLGGMLVHLSLPVVLRFAQFVRRCVLGSTDASAESDIAVLCDAVVPSCQYVNPV